TLFSPSALIIFATVLAGVSRPWGNTNVAINPVEDASLMLIASDKPAWLLIKSANVLVVQQINIPGDPVTLLLSHCYSEASTVIRVEYMQTSLNLHFPNGEKLLHFLWLATQPYKDWKRPIGLNHSALSEAWKTFNIPAEWP
ncbi:hypothetical protein BV22DRAFT_980786, partial [Leucogyrophana mollusca]